MARLWRGAGIAACGAFLVALLHGQTASRNNQEFLQFTSWNVQLRGNGILHVTVLGSPIKANLEAQKLRIAGTKFVGDMKRGAKGGFTILTANLSGNAQLIADRPSSNKASTQLQTVSFDTEVVVFDGPTNKATAASAVDFRRDDKGAGESLTMKGSSGWMVLYPAGQSGRTAAKSMHLSGPVTFKMTSVIVEEGKAATRVIDGRANSMDYDDAAGKLTLLGAVRATGDHPLMFGDLNASKVVFTINAKGEVDEIDVTGEPAKTEITRKPPPQRGRR